MKRRRLGAAGLAIAAVVAAQLWFALDGSDRSGDRAWTQSEAEAFEDYPVYWAGPEIAGLPLTWVIRDVVDEKPSSRVPSKRDGFRLIYGNCELDGADACPVPLSIRTTPRCYEPPELFPDYVKQGSATPLGETGAVVQDIGGHKQVWTGDIAISIHGLPNLQDAALDALQLINGAKFPAGEALRAPVDEPCDEIQGRPREDVLPSE